jgi:hypothetical protein
MILEMIAIGFASMAPPSMPAALSASAAALQVPSGYRAPPNQRQRRQGQKPQPISPGSGVVMPPTLKDYVLQHNKSLKQYFTHGQIYELDRASSSGDLSQAAASIIVMDRLGGAEPNSFQQLYLPMNVNGKDVLPLALVEYQFVTNTRIVGSYAVKNYEAQFTDYSNDPATPHFRVVVGRQGPKSVALTYSRQSGGSANWESNARLLYKSTDRKGPTSQFDISCVYMKCPFYAQKDPAKTKLQPWRFAPLRKVQPSPAGRTPSSATFNAQLRVRRVTVDK